MKILHTADWHLGAYVGPQCDDPMKRMENTIRCLDVLVETARQEQPDIILVCGDIFHQAKVWADRALTEVRVAAKYINLLSQFAPIAILYGTPNHDGEGQFKALREMTGKHVYFFIEPQILKFITKSGEIQVAGLPGFNKGHFRAQFPGLSAEEENQVFTQQLSQIVAGLSAQVDPAIPSILMAHHTVVGCELDNGQHIFQANEVVLPASVLDNSAFDLVCLGHIHKAQFMPVCNKPVYYAGSLDAFTFNDEGQEKGFWMHFLREPGFEYSPMWFKTPARKFQTFKWSPEYTANYVAGKYTNIHDDMVKGKVVRILYTCDFEIEKALDKKKLEHDLYNAGAYYVAEIIPVKIHEVVNRERLHEKLTVEECLSNYLKEKYPEDAEKVLSLMLEAKPIIQEIQASAQAGGQVGLFLPIEIEVRNYRSYAEEKLSFRDIFFAMVNGPNGVGKSSLFMDAIVDCLYEQPREGELTGWIRAGEKSGSVIFTFQLGEDIYRVTRTRQKSGKATLALARRKFFDGEDIWDDLSCQRLVDTQRKIIKLLGMDADTFKSCVLIMQDQYGRFMEAKPDDRMTVLANLLGLGIYEQLEKAAKEKLTEINRELKTCKQNIIGLEDQVKKIPEIMDEIFRYKRELEEKEKDLYKLRKERDEVAIKVANVSQLVNEKNQLMNEARKKSSLKDEKTLKHNDLMNKAQYTRSFLSEEENITEKYQELKTIREAIAAMDGKLNLLRAKEQQMNDLSKNLMVTSQEIQTVKDKIQKIENNLLLYSKLNDEVKKMGDPEAELLEYERKAEQHRELESELADVSSYINVLTSKVEACNKQVEMLNQSGCIDIERANCRFLKSAKEAAAQINNLQAEMLNLEQKCNLLTSDIENLGYKRCHHQIAREKAERYRKLKQQLAYMENDQKLLKEYKTTLNKLTSRRDEVVDKMDDLVKEHEVLAKECNSYEFLQEKIESLTQYENKYKEIPVAKNYLETIVPQIEELGKEIDALNNEIQTIRNRIDQLGREISESQKYQEELNNLEKKIQELESEVSCINRSLGNMEAEHNMLKKKEEELGNLVNEIEVTAARSSQLQILGQAFSQDGIPHQIIRDIIPELESSANEILGQMTGGRIRLEFRTEKVLKSNRAKEVATLDIVIIDVDHGELPYLARSGGQKVRAALAVSFALAMIKASRVGLQLGMMFVDEPPFLDTEGVEAYCMALEAIHNQYPEMRIIAISHDENMKAAFPQQLYIEMTEKGSKVRKA